MLIWESQSLDLKELRLAQQAIDIDTKGMSSQLGVKPSTQTPKSVSVVGFDIELFGKLVIDGFNDLANGIEKPPDVTWQLLLLISPGEGSQTDTIVEPEFSSLFSADVALVAQDIQIGMFTQQLKADLQIGCMGWSQFEIKDQPAHGDQQVQLEAKDSLFSGRCFSIGRSMRFPISGRTRHQIELYYRNWQAVNHALLVQGQIQHSQNRFTDEIESDHQISTPTIEPALRRDMWKQVSVFSPMAEHLGFYIPTPAFTNQGHRKQFAVTALWLWPTTLEYGCNWFPDIIHDCVCPCAEIVKIAYHWGVLLCLWDLFWVNNIPYLTPEDFLSITIN
jgi:hypothetical protein